MRQDDIIRFSIGSLDAVDQLIRMTNDLNSQLRVVNDSLRSIIGATAHNRAYNDFSKWHEHLIRVDTGLVLAPDDFCLTDDKGNSRSLFSWHEAITLEEIVLRPNGWRLPTVLEWRCIIEKYKGVRRLNNALNLSKHGWSEKAHMAEGQDSAQGDCMHELNNGGYYWSSTADNDIDGNAFGFYCNSAHLRVGVYSYPIYQGRSIRCVRSN